MEIDNDGLTIAGQRLRDTLGLDHHLQPNASASSGFMRNVRGGHMEPACGSRSYALGGLDAGYLILH